MARIRYIKYQFGGTRPTVSAIAENSVGTRYIVEAVQLPSGHEAKSKRQKAQADFVKRVNRPEAAV